MRSLTSPTQASSALDVGLEQQHVLDDVLRVPDDLISATR
jgi:hypothetical protein